MKSLLTTLNVRFNQVRFCALLTCLAALTAAFPSVLRGQTFEPIPALSFTMPAGGANPLTQLVTVTSTGANFNYSGVASTTSGGNWLTLSNFGYYGFPTPQAMTVSVAPPTALAAGTYSGKIVLTSASNSAVTLTIPVTLAVVATDTTFLDDLPGQLSFSLTTAGKAPPSQSFQIRNAGSGTLDWSINKSYGIGSAWLGLSETSGSGDSTVVATVIPSALPGGGLIAGSYIAQLAVRTTGNEITIPVVVVVGDATFRQINPVNFVKAFGGPNPVPQLLTVASTGTDFALWAYPVSSNGGDWLQISPSNYGYYGLSTPQGISISVNPAVDLPAGTYTSEVIMYTAGVPTVAVPVSLTIEPAASAFFDDVPGAFNFSMVTGGSAPPGQSFQIRNAGEGALSWTLSGSTSDGGQWLDISAASGAAPSTVTVTVVPKNLPGAGETPGAYTGQLILQSASGRVTIPISFVVGSANFVQQNPLSFTKAYAGGNPRPQLLNVASTGTAFNFFASVVNSTGGDWLQISPSNDGYYGLATPYAITVSVSAAASLAAGTYTADIIFESTDGTRSMNVPVSLTVSPTSTPFLDDLPGQLDFSLTTGGDAPPSQPIQIRNAGEGTLSWAASASTADGGEWLSLSSASGTAPSILSASVAPANLPGGGLVAGTYTGQVIVRTSTDVETVPVSVTVGDSVFKQVNGLNFTMTYGGANPLPQVFSVASTGTNFAFFASAVSATGGNWLQIAPSNYGYYGVSTPYGLTVSVSAPADLAPGYYSGEVVITSATGNLGIAVPVTLTVEPATATFFDDLPGQVSFSLAAGGKTPPAQTFQIRNAGAGTLEWTGSISTSDGGNWLSLSRTSGAAPSTISASIDPANLPGKGLTAGTFTGEIVLQGGGTTATIPVNVVVGPNVFQQVNALTFTMPYGGGNPLPQVLSVISTGANFNFFASAVGATGGNWLQISPSNDGYYGLATPQVLTVSVNAPTGLAAGTYTSQVIMESADGTMSMVVPVTLIVGAPTEAFFDDLPGQLGFSFKTGGTAPPAQTFQIRNGGAGTLDWTLATTTADGGSWLSVSAASGTALSNVTVSVVTKNLPGAGLVAGIYTGQIVLQTNGDKVTIPVTVDLGANVFQQISPLSFSKADGGENPSPQAIVVTSTGSTFSFYALAANEKGGDWLQISPSNYGYYGDATPTTITVSVNAAANLPAGVYTGEILMTSDGGGMAQVVPVTLTVAGIIHTATPQFAPPGGTYTADQSVIITDSTAGSSIFYTLDGSTPTTSSKVYSGPITVASSETINAIAVAPGYLQSATGKAVYVITPTSAPELTETITIAEATAGASVYYTTDGTTPTTNSKLYTGPIVLSASSTLKFIAIQPNHPPSAVRTVTTVIQ
jgi:hypothetical protein